MKCLLAVFFVSIAMSVGAQAATYYIDYATGSDSNNGTSKSTPWKHAPGMIGTSGNVLSYETTHYNSSNTDVAGDSFIFKGGVTWPNACFAWVWRWGGGTGWTVGTDAVYFGVDQTWYTGASWSRPIFDAQATDVTINTKGISPIDNVMLRIYKGTGGYFIVDNLEFKGMYHLDNNEDMMLAIAALVAEVKNCYIHGWGHGPIVNTGPCSDMGDGKTYAICNRWASGPDSGEYANSAFRALTTSYDNENNDVRVHHCYIDGSDSYPTPGNMTNATKGFIRHFYNNYIAYVQNALTNNFCWYVWGNTFEEICTVTDFVSNNHRNLYQSYGGSGKSSYVYNNLAKNVAGGATFLWYPTDSTKFYCFNNVIYGDNNATLVFSSGQLTSASNTAGLYAWNNTFQLAPNNPFFAIGGSAIGGSSSGYAAYAFFVKNNHLISTNDGIQPRIDTVVIDTATNVEHTNAAATSANYTSGSTYPFAPQAVDALTVGNGTNVSSICSSLIDSDPSYPSIACQYDSPLGVSINKTDHTVSYPNRTPILRGQTWDIGAYEYNAGGAILQLTSPNGGEEWHQGEQRAITWTAQGISETLIIEILQGATVLGTVATGINAASGTYAWTVGRLQNGNYVSGPNLKIRIRTADGAVSASMRF